MHLTKYQEREHITSKLMYEDLSNTYIYGVHQEGSCVGKARLSHQRITDMRKLAKSSNTARFSKQAEAKTAAIDGFELLMQVMESEESVQYYLPLAIDSWTKYFTYTVQFSLINSAFFSSGIHLILIGWHTESGSFMVRPKVVPHTGVLSDSHLQLIVGKTRTKRQLFGTSSSLMKRTVRNNRD